MENTIIIFVSLSAILLQLILSFNVWRARIKYKIKVPYTSWNENFERVSRAHKNTCEYMVLFLPLLWMSSTLLNHYFVWFVWIMWVLSRIFYSKFYYSWSKYRLKAFVFWLICLSILFFWIVYKLVFNYITL